MCFPSPVSSKIGVEPSDPPLPTSTPPLLMGASVPVLELENDCGPSSGTTSASVPKPGQEEPTFSVQVMLAVLQSEHRQQAEKEEDQQDPKIQTEHLKEPKEEEEPVDSVAVVLRIEDQQQPEQEEPKDLATVVVQLDHQQQKSQEEPTGSMPVAPTVVQVEPHVSVPTSDMNISTVNPHPQSRSSNQTGGKGKIKKYQNHNDNSGCHRQRRPHHQGKLNQQIRFNQDGVCNIYNYGSIYNNNLCCGWDPDHYQRTVPPWDRFSGGRFGAMGTQLRPVFHGPPFLRAAYHPDYKNQDGFRYTGPYFNGNMEAYNNGSCYPKLSFQGNMEVYHNGLHNPEPSFRGNTEIYSYVSCEPGPSFQCNKEVYCIDYCGPGPLFQREMGIYPNQPSFKDASFSRNHACYVPFLPSTAAQTPTQAVPLPTSGALPLPFYHPQSLNHKSAEGLILHSQRSAIDLGMEKTALKAALCKQIDYYFSETNLPTDLYLRRKMDCEGWVIVDLIAGFKRVVAMTSNISLILESLQCSDVVEVSGNKMRRRGDWQRWILPKVGSSSN